MLETYTRQINDLNKETSLQADRWYKEKLSIRFFLLLIQMKFSFLKTYILGCNWTKGFYGFMIAFHQVLYPLFSYAKYWELKERERGKM